MQVHLVADISCAQCGKPARRLYSPNAPLPRYCGSRCARSAKLSRAPSTPACAGCGAPATALSPTGRRAALCVTCDSIAYGHCRGKRWMPTEADARQVADWHSDKALWPRSCLMCAGWHLTSHDPGTYVVQDPARLERVGSAMLAALAGTSYARPTALDLNLAGLTAALSAGGS